MIELRRARRFCGILLLLLAGVIFSGAQVGPAPAAKELTASRIVLKDSQGRSRILIDAEDNQGGAVLRIFDEKGQGGISIGVGEFGTGVSTSGFSILDNKKNPRLIMGTGPTGGAGLRLLDAESNTRYGFLIGPNQEPIILGSPQP